MYGVMKKPKRAHEINRAIGDANRERIREFLVTHPGATRRECAAYLGMNEIIVGKHFAAIRVTWKR